MKYIIILLIVIMLLLIDFIIIGKKKEKIDYKKILYNISKSKAFKQDKKSNSYKSLQKDLLGAKIDMSPELFNVITLIIALISTVIVVIVSYMNKINLLINIDELKAVSELLDMPELLEINFNISINLVIYTFLIMVFLPRGVLKVISKLRVLLEENEILMLQTYTLMMIKANKPVKEILISLLERSKMFRSVLRIAVNSFSDNPNLALKTARESTTNQGFNKTILALEQALNNDRNTSIKFLDNHRKFTKELGALNNIKKNNMKSVVSTLLLVVPVVAFVFIAGYPFLRYALRMLSNTNF